MEKEKNNPETIVIGDITIQSCKATLPELHQTAKLILKDKTIAGYLTQREITRKLSGSYIS